MGDEGEAPGSGVVENEDEARDKINAELKKLRADKVCPFGRASGGVRAYTLAFCVQERNEALSMRLGDLLAESDRHTQQLSEELLQARSQVEALQSQLNSARATLEATRDALSKKVWGGVCAS